MNAPSKLIPNAYQRRDQRIVELDVKRRYQRELSDCESAIHRAKLVLTHFIAEKFRLHRELIELDRKLREHAITARWARETERSDLAAELKAFIVAQNAVLASFQDEYRQLEAHESGLSKNLRAAIAQVGSFSYGGHLSRALENLQRATRRLNSHSQFISNRVQALSAWMDGINTTHETFANELTARARREERSEKVVALKPARDVIGG